MNELEKNFDQFLKYLGVGLYAISFEVIALKTNGGLLYKVVLDDDRGPDVYVYFRCLPTENGYCWALIDSGVRCPEAMPTWEYSYVIKFIPQITDNATMTRDRKAFKEYLLERLKISNYSQLVKPNLHKESTMSVTEIDPITRTIDNLIDGCNAFEAVSKQIDAEISSLEKQLTVLKERKKNMQETFEKVNTIKVYLTFNHKGQ
jgi:hypothetical protein